MFSKTVRKINCLPIQKLVRWRSTTSLAAELQQILGEKGASSADSVRQHHSHDESHHVDAAPDVVVFPRNTEEVSKVARFCHERHLPLIPYGTGTGLEGGVCAVKGGVCVDLTAMDSITSVNAEDFDCSVQPGVTRGALNKYLRDTGLWFPVDPGADASLCGMAATSASGTNAVRYGTMRENVLNLEVVLADGRVIHTAGKGRRARKSAAGYNLTNLFVGSEGTLGIITQATLKLHGQPESTVSAVCSFPSTAAAVDCTISILQAGVPIARIELMDRRAMEACNKYSGLSYTEAPSLFLEFHGSEISVNQQVQTAEEICRMYECGGFQSANDAETRGKLWKARHDMYYATLAMRPGAKGWVTDCCVPISNLTELITKAEEMIESSSLYGTMLGHVGDGNFHILFAVLPDSSKEVEQAQKLADNLAHAAQKLDGTCTGEHGIGIGKRHLLRSELDDSTLELNKVIKHALDPFNILNPGKVI